jgi:hypothetical protein
MFQKIVLFITTGVRTSNPTYTIRFSFLLISQQCFFYRTRSSGLRPTPNLENQVLVFTFSSDRVAQFYSQTPDSLFVTFYDSHVYGGDIFNPPSVVA